MRPPLPLALLVLLTAQPLLLLRVCVPVSLTLSTLALPLFTLSLSRRQGYDTRADQTLAHSVMVSPQGLFSLLLIATT